MKIQELRDKLKQCSRDDVEKIASEMYKMLPKSKKEEADPLIEDIISGKSLKEKKKTNDVFDFPTLKAEINLFLENVDNDYYLIPNRVVPKSKRSKWRFEVKRFVKQLNSVPIDGENGEESAALLRELYKRLSYGCGHYIFPSDDPFQSIGIRQPDFYEMLTKRTFATGFTDEKIKNMLEDCTIVYIDRESLHIELEMIYARALTTSDQKYKAIELIKDHVAQHEAELETVSKHSHENYRIRCYIEEMCKTMLVISLLLYEPEDAIEYFWQHIIDSDKEIILYRLLDIISQFGDDNLWISIYEDSLKRNIEPRKSLKEKYNKLKNS